MNEQRNMPATDWEGEEVKIFRPEDLVRNDLAKKFEMLLPVGTSKERVMDLVDMVQKAKTPDFSWVPEGARGPVLHEARLAAEAFDRIAVQKVEAEMQRAERAKTIPEMQQADETERQEVIEKFRDEFAGEKKVASDQAELERLAQTFELPPEDQGRISQRQIPTMIVKRKDLRK
jgi:hypothetical protein